MTEVKRKKHTVTYVYDDQLAAYMNKVPHILNRAKLTHDLIEAYRLTDNMNCIRSTPAKFDDLKAFHASAYIDFLSACDEKTSRKQKSGFQVKTQPSVSTGNNKDYIPSALIESSFSENDDDEDFDFDVDSLAFENEHKLTHLDFGFGYDCPIFRNMGEFACQVAGGSLTAVKSILNGSLIAINWNGGWHHANRDEAKGFCFINDVVLSILQLQTKYPKILYIDLDAHHGDGVENAFSATRSVMTLSLHINELGFYPGTGFVSDVGVGRGKFYSVNVPFKNSVSDEQFFQVFKDVFDCVTNSFHADAVVVQCGVDLLSSDPLGSGNLTEKGLSQCVSEILLLNLPTLFLGGGGYNVTNAAKCWTYLTSIITDVHPISTEIPDHDNFLSFGPDYELTVSKSLKKSHNNQEYLDDIIHQVKDNLANINKSS